MFFCSWDESRIFNWGKVVIRSTFMLYARRNYYCSFYELCYIPFSMIVCMSPPPRAKSLKHGFSVVFWLPYTWYKLIVGYLNLFLNKLSFIGYFFVTGDSHDIEKKARFNLTRKAEFSKALSGNPYLHFKISWHCYMFMKQLPMYKTHLSNLFFNYIT